MRQGVFDDLEIATHSLETASTVHEAMEARRLVGLPVLIPEHNQNSLGA
jgi:hypothetical protein